MTNEIQFFIHTLFEMVWKGYKRVMCKRWVGDWTKTATYWPPALLAIAALISHPVGLLNQGPWGPSSLLSLVLHCFELQQLTPNSDLKLTRTSCDTGLYNCLTSTCFNERRICTQFNPSTVKVSPDIFDRMRLLFTQVHFLFDTPAGSDVNMLHSNFRNNHIQLTKME